MASDPLERLIGLVRRELGAVDARVLEGAPPDEAAPNVIYGALSDGRTLAVAFASTPRGREALVRRLEMLIQTFAQSIEDEPEAQSREPRTSATALLRAELRIVVERALAVDAAVIDANSPVVWGSAQELRVERADLETVQLGDVSRHQLVGGGHTEATDPFGDEDTPRPPKAEAGALGLTMRAVREIRALSALSELPKGRHFAHTVREPDFGFVARSFAGIYVLLVVYDAPFDEIRVERTIGDELPQIERLVLALPPLDPKPAPNAAVMTMRRPRRR
jgi:hypothetical protein